MDNRQLVKTSRFLSLVLRHQPGKAGISLDESGWVDVEALLSGVNQHSRPLTREQLNQVVSQNDKKRFEFSEDGTRIRASQGHSVDVNLGYESADPPEILLHGTVPQFLESIRKTGLNKGKRHHVHLHQDRAVANQVGQRRGKPVILTVFAKAMSEAGYEFFRSTNGVWLTEKVPPEFLQFPD
jgi:putative RNA 2'-phosphotransferase